jgi:hypothetical protein
MKHGKVALDVILLALFGVLCNTGVTGTRFHEIAGLAYAALILLHLALNGKWILAALRGRLRGKRQIAAVAVNIALLADTAVIIGTGIRASHVLFPAAIKASGAVLVIHAVGGTIAALLVLAHILLHEKIITRSRIVPRVTLAATLAVIIGYSLFGSVQGVLHHGLPKEDAKGTGQHQENGEKRAEKMVET